MEGRRAHALTCSGACRKRLQRRRQRGEWKSGWVAPPPKQWRPAMQPPVEVVVDADF